MALYLSLDLFWNWKLSVTLLNLETVEFASSSTHKIKSSENKNLIQILLVLLCCSAGEALHGRRVGGSGRKQMGQRLQQLPL